MSLLGPKDRRRLRRRCVRCASAHFKCSGSKPCIKCVESGVECTYPAGLDTSIIIESGYQALPVEKLSNTRLCTPAGTRDTHSFDQFFRVFIVNNDFSGSTSIWHRYLRASLSNDALVATSITAIGALHSYKSLPKGSRSESLLQNSLDFYQEAVKTLRKQLKYLERSVESEILLSLLSTTFLLGLFELMYDETGEGWQRHMMYGVSRLLDLAGPAAFESRVLRSLYQEIRLFEISRAMLLSQTTPLTRSDWFMLGVDVDASKLSPMNGISDCMLGCVDLSQRVHHCTQAHQKAFVGSEQLQLLANEGLAIRPRLQTLAKSLFLPTPSTTTSYSQTSLAQLYYCTTSIYLSGIYDYNPIWQTHNIQTPSISSEMVDAYVHLILQHCAAAVENSTTSNLLLLMPLRVAAARCRTTEQRRHVEGLLLRIREDFAVAGAFVVDVRDVWALKDGFCLEARE